MPEAHPGGDRQQAVKIRPTAQKNEVRGGTLGADVTTQGEQTVKRLRRILAQHLAHHLTHHLAHHLAHHRCFRGWRKLLKMDEEFSNLTY